MLLCADKLVGIRIRYSNTFAEAYEILYGLQFSDLLLSSYVIPDDGSGAANFLLKISVGNHFMQLC